MLEIKVINWDSSNSYSLFIQLRILEKKLTNTYRVLIAAYQPKSGPLKIPLPVIETDKILYIDIFDGEGNYMTVQKGL